ncbi:hypothetical protein LCGC14_0814870 [marine sediment metagenome]|uniref:Uncharacterized protein n=1 Tax=marine sediment metagenome TaxID=412755 RepID=A0A0F9ST56_9ZZZZ
MYIEIKGFVDKFGRIWDLPAWELCQWCGQPDNCGDCNHEQLTTTDVQELGCVGVVLQK